MRHKSFIFFIAFFAILLLPSFIHAKSNYNYVCAPKTDIYFGHISFTQVKHDGKDPVVIREGEEQAEVAVLNFPLTAGDTIRTTESRRCEIQFDTGTIIRLDFNTELKVETILAQSLSSRKKITNLVLSKGQIYIMYTRYNRPEVFQVMTPNTAVKLNHRTVATINAREDDSTEVHVKRGKAYVMYGSDEEKINQKKLKMSEKVTVSKDHEIVLGTYEEDVDFELWNDNINENFKELHRGKSFLPKPIQKLPKAVFHFAQKYSNLYGEWVWSSLYGYVWRPSYNDYYPWGTWRPYLYGGWREVNGQLFWVPEETWGWVPYHLGLWIWDKKSGWIWIPGSAFAPAWAMWDFYNGYYTWRPWALWNWWSRGDWIYPLGYSFYDYWDYYYYQAENSRRLYAGKKDSVRKRIHKIRKINRDQLEGKEQPAYPLPKELKKVYKNVVSAIKRGDKRVLESMQNIPEQMIIVKSKDLNASRIQEKSIKFKQFIDQIKPSLSEGKTIPQESHDDPYKQAIKTYKRNNIVVSIERSLISINPKNVEKEAPVRKFTVKETAGNVKGTEIRHKINLPRYGSAFPGIQKSGSSKLNPAVRFRDWNPDIKAAQRAGVSIYYSSRTNEIRCPRLGLSSKNVTVGSTISRGGFHLSGNVSSSGSRVSSSSSGSSRSIGAASSRSSGRSSSGSGRKK